MSGLRPSCYSALPVREHPGPLLHRLSGDIGVPPDPAPMDFSAWCEVFLGGVWYQPRIGRIVVARGRDAADVSISTAFGPAHLAGFKVSTEELPENPEMCGQVQPRAI